MIWKRAIAKVSNAKVDKISSIHRNLVIFKIGRIRNDTIEKLKDAI
jgi:hypothetical protein